MTTDNYRIGRLSINAERAGQPPKKPVGVDADHVRKRRSVEERMEDKRMFNQIYGY